jgi:hypothetical protein
MEAINLAVENLVQMRLKSVLKTIAADFELDLKILKERYLQVEVEEEAEESVVEKKTQKKKTEKKKTEKKEVSREGKCTCTTAKGLLCRNRALAGSEMCGIHARTLKAKSDNETARFDNPCPRPRRTVGDRMKAKSDAEQEAKKKKEMAQEEPVADVEMGAAGWAALDALDAEEREVVEALNSALEGLSESEGSEYVPSQQGEEEFV